MKNFLFLASLLCGFNLWGQKPDTANFRTGLMFNDEEYNQQPVQAKFAGSKFSELPLKVSLRQYCPTPADQGSIGSCVGWSTCYGALTTQYAIKNKWTDKEKITAKAFSALFVYNLVKANDYSCGGGTYIPLAMTKLKNTGTCLDKHFIRNNCSVLPNDTLKQLAKQYAIEDFMSLFTTTDESKIKIQKTKQSLAENKPVVIGMTLLDNFISISKTDPVWHPEKGLGWPAGGHAMCVIGYDDGKEQFEILNSWGEKWGENGYCYVKYSDYTKYCRYAFQMYLKPENAINSKNEMGGSFTFQYLKDRATLTFEPVTPKHLYMGYYTLEKKDWAVGDLFQLVAKNTKADEYVYVFSIDSKKESHVHFPRSQALSSDYEGFNETPLVPVKGAEIIIPTPESALSIGQAGTDYLVVLFSKTRIDNIKEIIAACRQAERDPFYALKKSIGTRWPKYKDVTYEPNKMSFTSAAPADVIVPLMLVVESK